MFYMYDVKTGKFLGKVKSAYYKPDGKLVEGYTRINPEKENEDLYFENGKWVIKEKPKDFRGKWINENGDEIIIKEIGEEPPDGYYQLRNQEYRDKNNNLQIELTRQFKLKQKKSEIETYINEQNSQLREALLDAFIEYLSGTPLVTLQSKYKTKIDEYKNLGTKKQNLLSEVDKLDLNNLDNFKVEDVTAKI